MNRLRVVLAIPFFEPAIQFGGSVVQAAALARGLAGRGHEVRVVTTDLGVDGSLRRDTWLECNGYQVWYGSTSWINRFAPYYEPMLRKTLTEALRGADVLHVHVGLTLLNAMARKVARRCGVPYVYSSHGCMCPYRLRLRRWSKWLFLRCFERRVLRGAAALQAFHEKDAADLIRQGADPKRVRLIRNGVTLPEQRAGFSRAFRQRQGVADNSIAVLFVGRLSAIKGLDVLLDAIARLPNERSELRLLIAGPDDGCRNDLERQAHSLGLAERVIFLGEQRRDALQAAFASADLFVLPSHSEGQPLAVLEACAHGLPALISPACNLPEVEQFNAGRVVPVDPEEIATALHEMTRDLTQLRGQGENARRMIREKFSLEAVVSQLEQLYRDCAALKTV